MAGGAQAGRTAIGRIAGPFGIHGEAKVDTADPGDLRAGLTVRAQTQDGPVRELVIDSLRPHQHRLLVRFAGIEDPEAVAALRGSILFAAIEDLPPLPAGAFRDDDLIGMLVTDARLGELGAVTGIMHYPHADMLVVGERALLVPMLGAYGVSVDAASRRISTALPAGFEDL